MADNAATTYDSAVAFTVHFGRYGGRYDEHFDSFAEACEFIAEQEERGEIFASTISDEQGELYRSRHPLAKEGRWEKVRADAPELPVELRRGD